MSSCGSGKPTTAFRMAAEAGSTSAEPATTTSTAGPAPLSATPRIPWLPAKGKSGGSSGQIPDRYGWWIRSFIARRSRSPRPCANANPSSGDRLDVGHHVFAAIACRQHRPGLAGGERLGRKHHDRPPIRRRFHARRMHRPAFSDGTHKAAQPACAALSG